MARTPAMPWRSSGISDMSRPETRKREGHTVKFKQTVLAAVALLMGATLSGPAFAVNDEPLTDHWAPSEWGPDDKADRPGS